MYRLKDKTSRLSEWPQLQRDLLDLALPLSDTAAAMAPPSGPSSGQLQQAAGALQHQRRLATMDRLMRMYTVFQR